MFNFDEKRFLRTQNGAVKSNEQLVSIFDNIIDDIDEIYFIGSGGVGILFDSTIEFLRPKTSFPFHRVIAAEFMACPNKTFGSKSLVIIPSVSGTTQETIELVDFCNDRNVKTLALVGSPNTPLEEKATFTIYNDVIDDTSSENYYIQGLLIALYMLKYNNDITLETYNNYINGLNKLPEALVHVKEQSEDFAKNFASKYKDTDYHILTGSGDSWAEAYYYGMCILEEMQWIKSRPVHSADFFHGTLELLEQDTSVIVVKGEDEYRALSDRVENFAKKITCNTTVIDTKDYELPTITGEVRKIISPIVIATIFERISTYLEKERNHPLTTRRYYKKMDY
ncbi:SIS domain-containing protein [Anaerococcus sp. Marseille-Q7828]|uniref:SIS domain-containing protein n=1 Tax=Anaerococcus sp. Marseille-Q7828 TaxID=3036300 RepID=UPI0024AD3836|nr:SIS domain-containing protein [Anaerococcus sp. Marseille-Q7828]